MGGGVDGGGQGTEDGRATTVSTGQRPGRFPVTVGKRDPNGDNGQVLEVRF